MDKVTFSTGSRALDRLFVYEPTVVHLFYGVHQSGKTTLACYCPITSIYKTLSERGELPEDGAFFVVDGDGGFSWDRMQQIAEAWKVDWSDLKSRIKFWLPERFAAQHKALVQEMRKEAKKCTPLFAVADPMVCFYRDRILTTPRRFRAVTLGEMTGRIGLQLTSLRFLAVKYRIPVCITSWSKSPLGDVLREREIAKLMDEKGLSREEAERLVPRSEVDTIGGRLMGFMPKVIVRLSIPEEGLPLREAYLAKHRAKPSGLKCRFLLSDKGVIDV